MLQPVRLREFYLKDGDKLIDSRVGSLQRVVRQMIKQSRKTRPNKKKRPS